MKHDFVLTGTQAKSPCRRAFFGQRHPKLVFAVLCFIFCSITFCVLASESSLFTSAPGAKVSSSGQVTLDYSNASQGYISIKHASSSRKTKVRVSYGSNTDTYDLECNGEYVVYPLKYGKGNYTVAVFANVSGTKYSQECGFTVYADITDSNICYLYPNQQSWYTSESAAVAKADELCEGLTDDMSKITAIYNFVKEAINYDYIKALTVETGYLPDVDATLESGMGICYDFSSLLCCMMRSQGIYCQIVTGKVNSTEYHAWNKVLVNGTWKMLDATYAGKYKSSAYSEEHCY